MQHNFLQKTAPSNQNGSVGRSVALAKTVRFVAFGSLARVAKAKTQFLSAARIVGAQLLLPNRRANKDVRKSCQGLAQKPVTIFQPSQRATS